MNIIKGVPNIKLIINNQQIKVINTIQSFKEDEYKVLLKCAEEIPEFKRGLVCDLYYEFELYDLKSQEISGMRGDFIRDLVLVYINKRADIEYLPQFEYVFYK